MKKSILGHEDECSLYIKPKKGYQGELPDEDECIVAMLDLLNDRYHAKPFMENVKDPSPVSQRRRNSFERHLRRTYMNDRGEMKLQPGSDWSDFVGPDERLRERENFFYFLDHGVVVSSFGRMYREIAGAYFECATWTASDPFELCKLVVRGREIAARLARLVSTDDYTVQCFNAVSDRKGSKAKSCGMHDSHGMRRDKYDELVCKETHTSRMTEDFLSFKVLARTLSGAGKIGYDCETLPALYHYQISERADFVKCDLGYSTIDCRPILHLRDEPHADRRFFARLHDINGEGNRSPWGIIFGSGLTNVFLMALEDEAIDLDWQIAFPERAFQELSRDIELNRGVRVMTRDHEIEFTDKPLILLEKILAPLQKYCGRSSVPSWCATVVGEAEHAVGLLSEGDPEGKTSEMLDWKIKKRFIESQMKRLHLDPNRLDDWLHPKIRMLDLSYHCLYGVGSIVWDAALEMCKVRDYEHYTSAGLSDEALFGRAAAEETSAFLLSLLAADPNLRERSNILNWSVIELWNNSPQEGVQIFLDDPAKFNKAFLSAGLGGNFDFSSESQRLRLIEFLRATSGDVEQIKYALELF